MPESRWWTLLCVVADPPTKSPSFTYFIAHSKIQIRTIQGESTGGEIIHAVLKLSVGNPLRVWSINVKIHLHLSGIMQRINKHTNRGMHIELPKLHPAGVPEISLKKRPAVLDLALLLRDADSQGRMEIRQLGHTHIEHLPHTGL